MEKIGRQRRNESAWREIVEQSSGSAYYRLCFKCPMTTRLTSQCARAPFTISSSDSDLANKIAWARAV